jgi:hypothetical protein
LFSKSETKTHPLSGKRVNEKAGRRTKGAADKEKGPPEDQRPKSREETPKEGFGARQLSLRCTLGNAAPHKSQVNFVPTAPAPLAA